MAVFPFTTQLRLIPLKGKRPFYPDWLNRDPETHHWKEADNIGIILGQQPNGMNIGCLDIDTPDPNEHERILNALGLTFDSPGVEHSLSGNLHIFFQYFRKPESCQIKNGHIELYFCNRQIALGHWKHNEPNPLENPFLLPIFDESWLSVLFPQTQKPTSISHLSDLISTLALARQNKILTGWDIDRALAHYLLFELNLTDEEAHSVFQELYGSEYSQRETQYILDHTRKTSRPFGMPSILYLLKRTSEDLYKQLKSSLPDQKSKPIKFSVSEAADYLISDLFYNKDQDAFYQLKDEHTVEEIVHITDLLHYRSIEFFNHKLATAEVSYLKNSIRTNKLIYFEFNPDKPYGYNPETSTFNTFKPFDYVVRYNLTFDGSESINSTPVATTKGAQILLKTVFGGNITHLQYFYAWLALKLYTYKTPFTPVISTPQGTGKDTLIKGLLERIDRVEKSTAEELNRAYDILDYSIPFIVLDEARLHQGTFYEKLKTIVGAPIGSTLTIHPKGKPARTVYPVCDLVLFSNDENPVAIKEKDRRLLVFKNNGQLLVEVVLEEYGQLLDKHLLNEILDDIEKDFLQFVEKVNVNSIMITLTQFALDEKEKTETIKTFNAEAYLVEALKTGELYEDLAEFAEEIIISAIDRSRFLERGLVKASYVYELLKRFGYKSITLKKVGMILKEHCNQIAINGIRYYELPKTTKESDQL